MKRILLISLTLAMLLSFPMAAATAYGGTDKETGANPLLAVKTNLLFDLLATPNLEVEVPVARRFSLMAEYWFPCWLDRYTMNCYNLQYGGIEARYWFGKAAGKDALRGHFVGAYSGFGIFDLGNIDGGYMGDIDYHGGLTYGYSFKVNKTLRFETSLSFGAVQTRYDNYANARELGSLVWQYSGRYFYVGPTKMKVSVVVLFHGKDKNK